MDGSNLIIQAVAVAMFAKALVDIIKISPLPSANGLLPILGVVFAFGIALLLDVTDGITLNGKACANAALVAILAGATAAGVTVLQNKGNQTQ